MRGLGRRRVGRDRERDRVEEVDQKKRACMGMMFR